MAITPASVSRTSVRTREVGVQTAEPAAQHQPRRRTAVAMYATAYPSGEAVDLCAGGSAR